MIGRISGQLVELDDSHVLVDVMGVGYEIEVSASVLQTLPGLGGELSVHTHFIVREDAQLLYGFGSKSERELFRAFIKISGVGPKMAMSLISSIDPQSLAHAVSSNDVSMLTKVPGVGKKTAERLMVELKNRLDALNEAGAVPLSVVSVGTANGAEPMAAAAEAEGALISLGYKASEANRAVGQVVGQLPEQASAEDILKLALQTFARAS